MKKGKVCIGTSGWHYTHWKGPFYPEELSNKEMLSFYVKHFSTVEMNRTFYSVPKKSVFQGYCDKVPRSFIFAVKASRFITHIKHLKDPKKTLKRFFQSVDCLKTHLGPILFQLSPSWKLNIERLASFLKALPKGHRYVFEFRNPTWLCDPVYDLLRKYNVAFCIYELDHFLSPNAVTADFVYVRLHGPKGAYQGSYSPAILKKWAHFFKKELKEGKDVYCYFDNDQKGYAAKNAMELKKYLIGLRDSL
jgi:uncharacterized protein YecE (DUF72 family)